MNITKGSLEQPLSPGTFKNSGLTQEMQNLEITGSHNTRDNTMPIQESSPGTSQSKLQVKKYLKESYQICDSGTGISKDIASPTCRVHNSRASTESQGGTRKPQGDRVKHLVDCLKPADIKGLTRRQRRDLKEGRKSPEHLIRKYTKKQSLKVNHEDNQKVSKEGWSSNNVPVENCFLPPAKPSRASVFELDIQRNENSPPNTLSSAQLKARSKSTLDGDTSQSLSLSKVVKYANYKRSLNTKTSDIHNDVSFTGEDKRTEIRCPNLSGKGQRLTKKVSNDPVIPGDRPTKR